MRGSIENRQTFYNKRGIAAIYDSADNFVGILEELTDISHVSIMNGGVAGKRLIVPISFDEIGDDPRFEKFNKIEVTITDKDAPSGIKTYTGFIGGTRGIADDKFEGIEIDMRSYSNELETTPFMHNGDAINPLFDPSVIRNDYLPHEILEYIIDNYRIYMNNPHINYTSGSLEVLDSDKKIAYTFNHKTALSAIRRLMDLCPIDYIWFVDATNTIHSKTISTTPDHYFIFGRDIVDSLTFEKRYADIRTGVLFWNGKYAEENELARLMHRETAVDEYDKRVEILSDGNLKRWNSWAFKANRFLDGATQEDGSVEFVVIDNNAGDYGVDLESLQVGDTFKIAGSERDYGDLLVITSIEYHLYMAIIIAEDRQTLLSRVLKDFSRRIDNQEYNDEGAGALGVGTYEAGFVVADEQWTEIPLKHTYKSPIIIANMRTYNGTFAVTNVQAKRIQQSNGSWKCYVRCAESIDGDDVHSDEDVCYMVVEEGVSRLPNGDLVEAGVQSGLATFDSTTPSFTTVNLVASHIATTVVYTAYNTSNDEFCNIRLQNVGTTSFEVAGQRSQTDSTSKTIEIFHIAVRSHNNYNLQLDGGLPTNVEGIGNYSGTWEVYPWDGPTNFNDIPIVFHQIQTMNGGDPVTSRVKNVTSTGMEVVCEEDVIGDLETNHAAETVALMGIARNASNDDYLA